MEQLFWRNNGDKEKFDLLFLTNFLTQKAAGFCWAQNNSLALGSLRYFAWKRYSQPSLFAKISNVIANRTFPRKCGRPSFLAKISDASHKSSLFLGVSEEFLDAKTLESSRKGGSGDRKGRPYAVRRDSRKPCFRKGSNYKYHLKEEIKISILGRR